MSMELSGDIVESLYQDVVLDMQRACSRCQEGRRCQHGDPADFQSTISDWKSGLCPLEHIDVHIDDVHDALSLKCVEICEHRVLIAVRRPQSVE